MFNQTKLNSLPFFYGLLLLLVTACKTDDEIITPPPPPDPEFVVETIIPTGNEQFLNKDSDYVFDQSKLPTFYLDLPKSSLQKIDGDPAAEEYVEGTLTFEGEKISPVGIRYKGSIGAFVNCVSGNDWSNPSGYKTCTKLSMKIKINWNGSDTKFYGLKKLQFHSQNNDPTQMRERLGYHLFRAMGIPGPRAVHARLMINGQFAGLFALVEQIDGRFTRYNFDDGKGNLYKEIWPINEHGQPHSEATYLNHLKTNEDDNPTAAIIRSFGQEIANADSASLQSVIANRMDIAEIISYAVVDRTIKNDDGAFHWYCGGDGCSNHNYYWYEEPKSGEVHLIPWDLDHAFENIGFPRNPVTAIADDWGETRQNCQPFTFGLFGFQQRSAACDKLTEGWTRYTTEYENLKTQFINDVFSEAAVNALLDAWSAQIRAATTEAEQAHDDALTVSEWESALIDLKNKLEIARNE